MIDAHQQAWRERLESSLRAMSHRIAYLCDPRALEQVAGHGRRRSDPWISSFLSAAIASDHMVQAGKRMDLRVDLEGLLLTCLTDQARRCAEHQIEWVRRQLQMELEELLRRYTSTSWIEAIEDRTPHELWVVLDRRGVNEVNP